MMGVYIKKMLMPRDCNTCVFFRQANVWVSEDESIVKSYCVRTAEQTFDAVAGFLANCPLVPVPNHPGRLIDAELLKAEFTGNFRDSYETALVKALIDCAPTIIPAEGGDASCTATPHTR